jgi:hypothetical protein
MMNKKSQRAAMVNQSHAYSVSTRTKGDFRTERGAIWAYIEAYSGQRYRSCETHLELQ